MVLARDTERRCSYARAQENNQPGTEDKRIVWIFTNHRTTDDSQELSKPGAKSGDVLRIATINAARWRGADATEGTIEKGKVAEGIEA